LWAHKIALHEVPTAGKILKKLSQSARMPSGLDEAEVGEGIPQAPQP
jgi:hypothetical protein